jgi:hypothetical protein
MIIALSGARCAGKDTVFNILRTLNQNMRRFAFADQLKFDLAPLVMTQFNIELTDKHMSNHDKEFIRPLLISYGMMWKELDNEHWARMVTDRITRLKTADPDMVPVVTDVRFEDELSLLKTRFQKVFHIHVIRLDASIEPTKDEKLYTKWLYRHADYHLSWNTLSQKDQENIVRNIYTQHIQPKL